MLNEVIKAKRDTKVSIILVFFYVLLFFKFKYIATSPIVGNISSFLASLIAISLTVYYFFLKLRFYLRIQLFIFLMFVAGYSTSIFTTNYRANDYLLNFQYFGIALIPLFYKLDYKIFKYAFLLLLLFFVVNIVTNVDPNDVFSVSRNNISVFILIYYSNYTIAAFQNNKNTNIWFLVLSFLISIWAVGRGGIISIGLLLLLMPYCKQGHFSFKLIVIYVLILIIGSYIIVVFADTFLSLAITRFDSMGFDPNGRDEPNAVYWNSLFDSYFNFMYGVNLAGNNAFEALDLNPHNSLIRLHIFYGIFGFLGVGIFLMRSLIVYVGDKNYVYALLLCILLLRSLVDSTAFHGPFDGLIYYFIFYTLYQNISFQKYKICFKIKFY